jgi:DNA-binding XRE family transcriptional regulator
MATNINPKIVREKARKKQIWTLSELARRIGCSRQSIYFACKNPRRYPIAHAKILAAIE